MNLLHMMWILVTVYVNGTVTCSSMQLVGRDFWTLNIFFFGPYQPHVILSFYVVAKLVEGDSSRKIVELIYGTSRSKPNNNCSGIERILKVHNMQKILAQIEEYREMVKIKASKLPKKHPRNRVV